MVLGQSASGSSDERAGPDGLRVLFVCASNLDNASAKQALWFGEELTARGHHVLLALYGDPDDARGEAPGPGAGVVLTWHKLRGRGVDEGAREAVVRFKPTLVHAWNPQVSTVAVARAYGATVSAPLFVHFEDDDWSMRRGAPGRPLHRVIGFKARQALARVWPAHGGGFTSASTLKWIVREATALDALTPVLAKEVAARLGRDCAVVMPVTPARTAPVEGRPFAFPIDTAGRLVVAYTGNIGPVRDAELRIALEAVALLQRAGRPVSFVHAGYALPRYDLPALARKAGVADGSAAFLGYVPFEHVRDLLSSADVLVQPGPPSEFNRLRLPSKMQAYLASGTPTITFGVGLGEMLVDRTEVLKLSTDSPVELARRIAELADDQVLYGALSDHGPAAAARLFDPATNVEALIQHYRDHLPHSGERAAKAAVAPATQRGVAL